MTALTPRQFNKEIAQTLARVRRELADLPDLYARAYTASHERIVRESAGKISGGRVDPTEQIVGDPLDRLRPGSQASIRKALENAETTLAQLENMAGSITPKITSAMDRLDPRDRFEPLRYPISVSKAQLEESEAAKARRVERGEDTA